jgi:Mrp family chromosome partitioning ATPase
MNEAVKKPVALAEVPPATRAPQVPPHGQSLLERAMQAFEQRPVPPAVAPVQPAVAAIPPVQAVPAVASMAEALNRMTQADQEVAAAKAPPMVQVAPVPVAAPMAYRINQQQLAERGYILPGSAPSAQLEEFRLVKRQLLEQVEDLRRQGAGVEAKVILVTSALPEEGKTFCAINLALSIAAERDSEAVLVDLDMARLAVLEHLGLPNGPGYIDAIADPAQDVGQLLIHTDLPGLTVLPGGRPTSSDAEYLASARARQVLEQLVDGHPRRVIIIDTPPVLAASLATEVAKLAGQTVLVVKAESTAASAVQDAASLLGGCPNVQALLNGAKFSPSGRRFGSYYNYRG